MVVFGGFSEGTARAAGTLDFGALSRGVWPGFGAGGVTGAPLLDRPFGNPFERDAGRV